MQLRFNITALKEETPLPPKPPAKSRGASLDATFKQMLGYKFRRQYSVGNIVIDFYCPELRHAIEVDGDSHFTPRAMIYDRGRQNHIESFGIRFLRVMNQDVDDNLEAVLDEIEATIRGINRRE